MAFALITLQILPVFPGEGLMTLIPGGYFVIPRDRGRACIRLVVIVLRSSFPYGFIGSMVKMMTALLFLLSPVAVLPLQAEEEGVEKTLAGIGKQIDCSLWSHRYPRPAPACFRGVCKRSARNEAWIIDLFSVNGCILSVPMTVPLGKSRSDFIPEEGKKCSGIVPVLIPPGAEEKPGQWKDAGLPALVVLDDRADVLPFLQDAVLEYYQYQAGRSLQQAISILQQMTDEQRARMLEKNWAFESVDCILWVLMEGSVPLDARMAYGKRYPAAAEQSRRLSEDYQEALESLQNKPWSVKLNMMKGDKKPLSSPHETDKPVPGIERSR